MSEFPREQSHHELPLPAILAGGRSRRFGTPKALAEVAGQPLLVWVVRAVRQAVPGPVLITDQAELGRLVALPVRADVIPGAGPLGGIHTALLWARELGRLGALCVGCDTPFLAPRLLTRLAVRFANTQAAVVAPESGGPLGVEPLCAVYGARCLPEVERRLRSREHALEELLQSLDVEALPLAEVRECGDPERMFFNVNTAEQHARAQRLARAHEAG